MFNFMSRYAFHFAFVLIVSAALLPLTVFAQDADQGDWGISGNVALTNDYKFRGISQSDESLAIQGGFDLEHSSGFYVGIWGSSVDFDINDGNDGSLELDLYLGYGGDIGSSGMSYDIGYIFYDYPGDDGTEGDYQEVYAGLGWEDLSVGLAYSNDYWAETGKFWYFYADYSLGLPNDFAVDFHVGYNKLDEKRPCPLDTNENKLCADGPMDGEPSTFLTDNQDKYLDYSISISRDFSGINLALAYVGTGLDKSEAFNTDWGEGIIQFTLSKSL